MIFFQVSCWTDRTQPPSFIPWISSWKGQCCDVCAYPKTCWYPSLLWSLKVGVFQLHTRNVGFSFRRTSLPNSLANCWLAGFSTTYPWQRTEVTVNRRGCMLQTSADTHLLNVLNAWKIPAYPPSLSEHALFGKRANLEFLKRICCLRDLYHIQSYIRNNSGILVNAAGVSYLSKNEF